MSKIIIDNKSNLPDSLVLVLVGNVIDMGRISNNDTEYCYCTIFSVNKCAIYASRNKCSDRFRVVDDSGFKGE